MKKYDLLRSGDSIIRVLEVQGDRVLVIDCIKRTMPVWVETAALESYSECTSSELSEVTGVLIVGVDNLDTGQRKTMYERYTMIAPILAFVADDRMRSRIICSVAEEHGVSKATVRSYLCLYLAYMDVTAYQFRYFYRKTRRLQNFYISRDGLKNYQRNNRPLTGDGVQEFAPAVGTGMFDATVCNIYLVNEAGSLVGRPILTACIDAYSGLCCGYSLSWEV